MLTNMQILISKFIVLLLEDKEDQTVYTQMIMSFTNELHCILKMLVFI